jgi:hypothetical protein
MTQAQIQALINQIIPGANYRANQMNPLLTDILAAAYGPMFIDNAPPSGNEDETQGYRPGSVAYDTSSQRFFICKDATAGAADWVLIPADANYEYKLYSSAGDGMTLFQNTSVFKADNNSLAVNLGCYVDLPANPYRGKVVILYFQDSIDQFDIRDSLGAPIIAGASLTIIGGQQFTIVYNGAIWEIIGIANINPATLSNVAVTKGATVIPNTTAINFIGSSVTVAPNGSGADVTISPVTGVDIKVNAFPIASPAQFINVTGTNLVTTVNTTGVDITYVSKIGIKKNGTTLTTSGFFSVGSFNFKGTMFEVVDFNVGLDVVNVESNGATTWYGFANMIPGASDDDTQGYSRGSVGVNVGTLKRNYICTDNTTGAATWIIISEDNGYESPTLIQSPAIVLGPSTANVGFGAVGALTTTRINLPAFPYIGKKVYISFQSDVTNATQTSGAQIRNSLSSLQFNAVITGATPANPKMIVAVCVDDVTETWVRLQ